MDGGLLTLLIFCTFLTFLVLGIPIAFCLFGVSMIYALIFLGPASTYIILSGSFRIMTMDVILAAPLFVFMATAIEFSGLGSALYDVMYKWCGPLKGGLAIGTVLICTLLAAMTGLGATGVVVMGLLGLPEMLKRGYDKSLAIGCIPAAATLGPIIPPSIVMIVVAAFAQQSVGKMFMGGLIPGLIISFMFCGYIAIKCYLKPSLGPALPPNERATWREKFVGLRGVILPIILIIAVLGSIYTGIATATEAAGVGAFGAILCALIYRQLTWKNLRQAMMTTLALTGMILWLMGGGACFGGVLGAIGVNRWVQITLSELQVAPITILILIQVITFIMACLVDGSCIIVILVPLFVPILKALGIDILWFCILFSINLCIGYITPPFGMNLFYTKGIVPKDISMTFIYRSVVPFIIIEAFVLVLCFIFPEILMFLPNMMK